jgi:AraC-like DNA-binding protein
LKHILIPDLPGLNSEDCGCAMLNPGWAHMRRRIPETVIILGKKNSALVDEEGEEIEIAPNRICILAAGRLHFGKKAITEPVSYYWLHFTTPSLPLIISESEASMILNNKDLITNKLSRAALIKRQLDLEDPEPFNKIFHDLLYEQERPSYAGLKFQVMVQSLLINATEVTISQHLKTRSTMPGTSLTYTILSLIAEHLSDTNLSIKYIADTLRHNPDYIGRQFKQVMRITIGEYILQKRVELATLRLQETYASVTSIAAQCGFGSVRNFLRQFKAVQGITPTELRSRYRAMYINSL